jgi:hypothetical protein
MTWWILVAAGGVVLFALAWWSSGRSRGRGRRQGDGDAEQDTARLWAGAQKITRGGDAGGMGGSPF